MSLISINYLSAAVEANRLKTAAAECANAVSANKNALGSLSVYWEGEAAAEYIAANERWRKEMESIQKELLTISQLIKTTADGIKTADEKAAAAVKK